MCTPPQKLWKQVWTGRGFWREGGEHGGEVTLVYEEVDVPDGGVRLLVDLVEVTRVSEACVDGRRVRPLDVEHNLLAMPGLAALRRQLREVRPKRDVVITSYQFTSM